MEKQHIEIYFHYCSLLKYGVKFDKCFVKVFLIN